MLRKISILTLLLLISCAFNADLLAQENNFKGQILDIESKQGVPFATLSYVIEGSGYGATSDFEGNFTIDIHQDIDSIMISHLAYSPIYFKVANLKKKNTKIYLKPLANQIQEIVITAKKEKYSNKNNPAVDFIRNVIEKKADNQIINYSPLNYQSHNKSLIALDNMGDKEIKRLGLKSIRGLMNNLDPTYFGNTDYLPIYFFEELTSIYAGKNTPFEEQVLKTKDIELMEVLDHEKAKQIKSTFFSKINLYDDYINILGNQLMSPLHSASPSFYKFFIEDTVILEGRECIVIDFIPRNIYDLGFLGDIYLTNDGKYELIKAELSLSQWANINFVDKIHFNQKFKTDSLDIRGNKKLITYIEEDAVYAKLKIYGLKVYGYSINNYSTPSFAEYKIKKDSELSLIDLDQNTRISKLSDIEKKTYQLPDSLNKITWFRITKFISQSFYGGYFVSGPLAFGPLDNTVSYNDIEGTRLRFSGKTNYKLSRRVYVNWLLAYGTKDEKFKYDLDLKYSFNTQGKTPMYYPANYLGAKITNNTFVPSQTLGGSNYDRISLSLTNILNFKLAIEESYLFQWYKQSRKGFIFNPYIKLQKVDAYGNWTFENLLGKEIKGFEYNRIGLNFSITLNGRIIPSFRPKYKQGVNRTNLSFNYEYGFENTHLLKLRASRKYNFMPLGYMNVWAEAGNIWGRMLSPYLFVNPTFNNIVYSRTSFNLMRPLEFYSDRYIQFMAAYNMNGYIFNRIPLIRKLKLREEFNIKIAHGSLRDENRFMINGIEAKSFGNEPYIEAGFGFQNLFGILGAEYIQRLTHNENIPNNQKWGIRLNLVFGF